MNQTRKAVKAFLVPVLLGVYMIFFWRSTSGMPLGGKGVPRLLIGALALLILVIVIREAVVLRRGDAQTPVSPVSPESTAPSDSDDTSDERVAGTRVVTPPVLPTSIGPPIAIIVALLAYWGLLTRIGAYPSTALFVIGLSLALGYRRPLAIIAAAVACVIVVYAFIRIFTLPLAGWAWF